MDIEQGWTKLHSALPLENCKLQGACPELKRENFLPAEVPELERQENRPQTKPLEGMETSTPPPISPPKLCGEGCFPVQGSRETLTQMHITEFLCPRDPQHCLLPLLYQQPSPPGVLPLIPGALLTTPCVCFPLCLPGPLARLVCRKLGWRHTLSFLTVAASHTQDHPTHPPHSRHTHTFVC